MNSAPIEEADREIDVLRRLVDESVALIRRLQAPSGAYPASPTFSAYRGYSWFRDGAFIADAMSSVAEVDSANAFFDWCSATVLSQRAAIELIVESAEAGNPVSDSDMLPTRFTLDGSESDDEWWDFQLDGYGTWLWAVVEHARRHEVDLSRWAPAITLTMDYLISSWSRPCYDWWEEHKDQVHVSTLGCIYAGLAAVTAPAVVGAARERRRIETVDSIARLIAERGTRDGHLVKWLDSRSVDASLLSLVSPLNVIAAGDPVARATVDAVRRELLDGDGVHRYAADTFYGGGSWPLLSCFLGLVEVSLGDRVSAMGRLRWAAATVNDELEMPEQADGNLLFPDRFDEWDQRWGPVARPLLWSHAMYIRLAAELGVWERNPA